MRFGSGGRERRKCRYGGEWGTARPIVGSEIRDGFVPCRAYGDYRSGIRRPPRSRSDARSRTRDSFGRHADEHLRVTSYSASLTLVRCGCCSSGCLNQRTDLEGSGGQPARGSASILDVTSSCVGVRSHPNHETVDPETAMRAIAVITLRLRPS